MRLLFLIHAYPPDVIGGHEIRCQRTVEGLRQRGHEVLVLTGYKDKPSQQGYILRLLEADLSHHVDFKRMLQWGNIYRKNWITYKMILHQFKPNIVLLWHSYKCTNLFVRAVLENSDVPVVMFIGSPTPLLPDGWTRFWSSLGHGICRRLIKSFLRTIVTLTLPEPNSPIYASVACFNSYFLRDWAMGYPYFHCRQAVVIHGGVDATLFRPRQPDEYNFPPHIAYIGRIDPSKGLETLVKALAKVHYEYNLSFKASIVGPISEVRLAERLKSMVQEFDLTDKILLKFNEMNPHKVAEFLRKVDIFVHPAICDWFPNSVLEAMASGCAIITTESGGQKEVIEHKITGLLIQANDVDELAKGIMYLIQQNQFIVTLGQNAQYKIHNSFTFKHYLNKLESLLEDIVK